MHHWQGTSSRLIASFRARRLEAFVVVPLFSAALLPLVKFHGHPADYPVLAAWLVVASTMIIRRRGMIVGAVSTDVLGLAALAVLIIAAAASALDAHAESALSVCFRFISYAEVIVLVRCLTPESFRLVRRLVYVAAAALAISVYAQRMGFLHSVMPPYHDPEAVSARYGGLIGHPNFAAYTLLATSLVALLDDALPAPWKAAAIALFLPAALLSGARTASVMFVVAVVIAAVLAGKRILLYTLPVALLAIALSGVVLQRIRFLTHSGGLTGQNAGGWRISQWRADLSLHPWYSLVGIGWDRTKVISGARAAAHSGYIQIISELGLIGVVGFLMWLTYVVITAHRVGWRQCAPLLAFILVCNVVDPVILYPATTYTWLILLLVMTRRRLSPPYSDRSVSQRGSVHA